MALFDSHKDFAYSQVLLGGAPSPATTGNSLKVLSGQSAYFPTPPFRATVWPAGTAPLPTNAEVIQVNAILASDVFVISRAQEGTTARSIQAGDQIAATITTKPFTDVESAIQQKTVITVGMFDGADYVCDGIQDEVQFLSACNQVGSTGGGIVKIGPGTFNSNTFTSIKYNNIEIIGSGLGSTTIVANYDASNTLEGHQGIFDVNNSDNVTPVSNFKISGISFNLNNLPTAAVSVRSTRTASVESKNFLLEDLEIYNRGVDHTGSTGALQFYGLYTTYNGTLKNIRINRVEIRDGVATTTTDQTADSIRFLGGYVENVSITNSYFHDVYGHTIRTTSQTQRTRKNWLIDNCTFVNTQRLYWGSALGDFTDTTNNGFDGLKITNCKFERVDGLDDDDTYHILVYNTINFIIDHCLFENSRAVIAPGGQVGKYGTENQEWTFSNNIIYNAARFGDLDSQYGGIYANNVFYNIDRGGLLGGYGYHTPTVYTGNLFYNCCLAPDRSSEYLQGIFLLETSGNTIQNNTIYNDPPQTKPGAPTVSINTASGNLNGVYTYKITLVGGAIGETEGGSTSATVQPINQKVNLSNIPVGVNGCRARRIYRTVAGGGDGTQKLVAQISNNTDTTYTDNIADSSLGVDIPIFNGTTNGLKYIFCELYGGLESNYPNIYKNNTVIGSGASTSTFYLDQNFSHIISNNTGLTESIIQNSANGNKTISSKLPATDVLNNNYQVNGVPVLNSYKGAGVVLRGTQNPDTSVVGLSEIYYNPVDKNLYYQDESGAAFIFNMTAGTSTSTSSTSMSSTSSSSTSSSISTSSTSNSTSISSTSSSISTSSTSKSTTSSSHSTSSTSSSHSTSSTSNSTTILAFG